MQWKTEADYSHFLGRDQRNLKGKENVKFVIKNHKMIEVIEHGSIVINLCLTSYGSYNVGLEQKSHYKVEQE